jgi:hypothetical protein
MVVVHQDLEAGVEIVVFVILGSFPGYFLGQDDFESAVAKFGASCYYGELV